MSPHVHHTAAAAATTPPSASGSYARRAPTCACRCSSAAPTPSATRVTRTMWWRSSFGWRRSTGWTWCAVGPAWKCSCSPVSAHIQAHQPPLVNRCAVGPAWNAPPHFPRSVPLTSVVSVPAPAVPHIRLLQRHREHACVHRRRPRRREGRRGACVRAGAHLNCPRFLSCVVRARRCACATRATA